MTEKINEEKRVKNMGPTQTMPTYVQPNQAVLSKGVEAVLQKNVPECAT